MEIFHVHCPICSKFHCIFCPLFFLLCLSCHGHLSSRVRAEKVCASTLQSQMSLAKKGRERQVSLVKLRGGFIRQKTRRRGTIIRRVQTPAGASCLSPACHPVHKSNLSSLSYPPTANRSVGQNSPRILMTDRIRESARGAQLCPSSCKARTLPVRPHHHNRNAASRWWCALWGRNSTFAFNGISSIPSSSDLWDPTLTAT